MQHRITIIDYGMGNIKSVENAFNYLGAATFVTRKPAEVISAETLVLPGVGAFRSAMLSLGKLGLVEAIQETVMAKRTKILGICLGMQLMGTVGAEGGATSGLGFIPMRVEKIDNSSGIKIPHVGFNEVLPAEKSFLMRGLVGRPDFYFLHSYRMGCELLPGTVSTCFYGETFAAAYENENVFATQFHPEKSQTNGLQLLKNFLSY